MKKTQEKMVQTPAPIPQGVVKSTPQAWMYSGGVATGKTQALVERVAALVEDGSLPGQVLVLCATPDAATQFKARLTDACAKAAAVRVTTAREVCLGIMEDSQAQAATGRDARLLTSFERDFLMEDLKTSAMEPRRIKEMMKFFYKCMTELSDLEEGWLITPEEEAMFDLFKSCMGFMRGILEPELANLVATWLLEDPAACARFGYAHVVVDDYQMMSRASQVVANLLAQGSIAIATDPQACLEVFDSYPYAPGAEEFAAANPDATIVLLSQSHACAPAVRASNMLRADMAVVAEPLDPPEGEPFETASCHTQVIEAKTPSEEIEAVVGAIQEAIESGIPADDILVASTHRLWSRNVSRALAAKGIGAEMVRTSYRVSGDSRDCDACAEARVLTGLYLVANELDGVAWRSWCGFGDWVLNATAMFNLRDCGGATGQAIDAVLHMVKQRPIYVESKVEFDHIMDAYDAALAMFDQVRGLEGSALLTQLTHIILGSQAEVPRILVELTADDGEIEGDSAAAMAARARKRLCAAGSKRTGCVHIASYEETVGYSPKMLVLCGFVNGLFPSRDYFDRTALMEDEAELVYKHDAHLLLSVVGKPAEKLVVSYFDHTSVEAAEQLKMRIKRIRLLDKKRVALTEPSIFLHRIEG